MEHNLAVVDEHIQGEARDIDPILDLYTDDIVFEVPGWPASPRPRRDSRDLSRDVASDGGSGLQPLDRFATGDRVVDDMIVRMRLVGGGVLNAPLPVGSRVERRLVHHFRMRNGLIAREQVVEWWRALDEADAVTGGAVRRW